MEMTSHNIHEGDVHVTGITIPSSTFVDHWRAKGLPTLVYLPLEFDSSIGNFRRPGVVNVVVNLHTVEQHDHTLAELLPNLHNFQFLTHGR
nr:hypothetical protein Iba_chr14bCG10880 [Ipomoea batatas]